MKNLVVLLAVLIGVVGCWKLAYPSGSWRYRLTLTVETPEGIKTGSAVREVHVEREPKILPEQDAGHASAIGEAVVIDLGKRGLLFALLRSKGDVDYGHNMVFDLFPMLPSGLPGGGTTPEGIKYYSGLEAKRDVPFAMLPMLVRFRDINNPDSVEEVDPDDLAESFGSGVKLVSATIEMTHDRVTTGVDKELPWLAEFYNKRLNGDRYSNAKANNRLANDLSAGSFSTGGS